ncbi:MAG: nucleotidyltransferase domain-containing protein [Gaiellaceae bacterium]
MATAAEASLTDVERRVLGRFVRRLEREYGDKPRAVWLYGSRARGEEPTPYSDVNLLVVTEGGEDWLRVGALVDEAAEAEGANPVLFSAHVYSPERLAQRRGIRSFFIGEVDRDKIVLSGEP